ncbi:3-keto-disaccharide hydrolase [Eudoraea chungangensis]|uniref:3-keto-disaccharide hydrolase n=1 Tax=Eudoraea chungangensis TaxID=1481905 RepID=UPI0023EC9472|nr:DUF1080 domain-containing protein [Eudoraea chungangensis]
MFKKSNIYQFIFLFLLVLSSCSEGGKAIFIEGSEDWVVTGKPSWEYDNGVLIATSMGSTGFVMTKNTFSNFVLTLEFYPDELVNSGVFVRCKNSVISNTDCYEMNIWDIHPNQKFRTGSIVTRTEPLTFVNTVGKWNTYKIVCDGNEIKTWINDQLTADILNDELVEGYIALQVAEPGRIRFRNIKLKNIE